MAKKLIGSKSIKAYREPLFQKPKNLGLDMPGFHYWGRNPDDGTKYGAYVCDHDGLGIITADTKDSVFCASCNKPMKRVGSFGLNKDGSVKTSIIAKLNRATMYTLPACPACNNGVITSANWIEGGADSTFCIHCGENLTDVINKVKASGTTSDAKSNEILQSVLATPESFKDLKVEDIDMSLYRTENDALWNISIQGMPVAQISLSAQPDSNDKEVVKFFYEEDNYSRAIIGSIVKMGLIPTLEASHAKVWASQTDVADVYKKARTEAHALTAKENSEFKNEFLANIALVCAGMDKNFYSKMKNHLKGAFFNHMEALNIPEANIIDVVESSFKEGAMPYFEAVLNKATEYLELSAQAKDEIREAIGGSGYIDPRNKIKEETAGSKLEANSIDIAPMGNVAFDLEKQKQEYQNLFSMRK